MGKENIVELKNISVAFDGEQVLDGLHTIIIYLISNNIFCFKRFTSNIIFS